MLASLLLPPLCCRRCCCHVAVIFARGPPAQFARRPGPPFCTPPPFAHPPIPHKGGCEGGGTHPPPARARTLPGFAPPWLRAAVLCTPRPVHVANGEGGCAETGEGVRARTHTPLCAPCTHSPFVPLCANRARVCPPPTLCTRPTEHAEKKGGGGTHAMGESNVSGKNTYQTARQRNQAVEVR